MTITPTLLYAPQSLMTTTTSVGATAVKDRDEIVSSVPSAAVTVEISTAARRMAWTQNAIASMRDQGFSDTLISEWESKGGIDIRRLADIAKWGDTKPEPGELRVMQYQEHLRILGFSDQFIAEDDRVTQEKFARDDANDVIRQAADQTHQAAIATSLGQMAAAMQDPNVDVPEALRDAFDLMQRVSGAIASSSSAYGQQLLSDYALRARVAQQTDLNGYIDGEKRRNFQARWEAEAEVGKLGKYGLDGPVILHDTKERLVLNSFVLKDVAGFQVQYDAVSDKVAIIREGKDVARDLIKDRLVDPLTDKLVPVGFETVDERVDAILRERNLSDDGIASWRKKYGGMISTEKQRLDAQSMQIQQRNRINLNDALSAEAHPELRNTAEAKAELAWVEGGKSVAIAQATKERDEADTARRERGLPSTEEIYARHRAMQKAEAALGPRHPSVMGYRYVNGEVTLFNREPAQSITVDDQLRQLAEAPLAAIQSTDQLVVESMSKAYRRSNRTKTRSGFGSDSDYASK